MRSGWKILDVAGVVTFGVIAAVGLVGDRQVDEALVNFGRGGSTFVLAAVMAISAFTVADAGNCRRTRRYYGRVADSEVGDFRARTTFSSSRVGGGGNAAMAVSAIARSSSVVPPSRAHRQRHLRVVLLHHPRHRSLFRVQGSRLDDDRQHSPRTRSSGHPCRRDPHKPRRHRYGQGRGRAEARCCRRRVVPSGVTLSSMGPADDQHLDDIVNMPSTTAALTPLSPILGRWRTSGTVFDQDGNRHSDVVGTDSYWMLPDGHWIGHDVDVTIDGHRTVAHELIGGMHPDGGYALRQDRLTPRTRPNTDPMSVGWVYIEMIAAAIVSIRCSGSAPTGRTPPHISDSPSRPVCDAQVRCAHLMTGRLGESTANRARP